MSESIYVMADIHGQYDAFIRALQKIKFSEQDKLYILGDIIDRGPKPVEIYDYIVNHKNIELLMGNHEKMFVDFAKGMGGDIKNKGQRYLTGRVRDNYTLWIRNGGMTTEDELHELSDEKINEIIDFFSQLPYYKKIELNGQKFLLCHSKPMFYLNMNMNEVLYEAIATEEIIWNRNLDEFDGVAPDDYIVIHGHTPTIYQCGKNKIYKYMNEKVINIDCGCAGCLNLGILRLNDMKEFYVSCEEKNENEK